MTPRPARSCWQSRRTSTSREGLRLGCRWAAGQLVLASGCPICRYARHKLHCSSEMWWQEGRGSGPAACRAAVAACDLLLTAA